MPAAFGSGRLQIPPTNILCGRTSALYVGDETQARPSALLFTFTAMQEANHLPTCHLHCSNRSGSRRRHEHLPRDVEITKRHITNAARSPLCCTSPEKPTRRQYRNQPMTSRGDPRSTNRRLHSGKPQYTPRPKNKLLRCKSGPRHWPPPARRDVGAGPAGDFCRDDDTTVSYSVRSADAWTRNLSI